jgi:hypothetical protein
MRGPCRSVRRYKLRLQASNAVGDGPFGPARTGSTKLAPPAGPTVELVNSTANALKMKLHFHKADAVVQTRVEVRGATGAFEEVFVGSIKSFRLAKLWPASVYELRACGTNSAGTGRFGPPAFFCTKELDLTVPTFGPIMNVENGDGIELAWSGATQADEEAGVDYELQLRLDEVEPEGAGTHIRLKTGSTWTNPPPVRRNFSLLHVGLDTCVGLCVDSGDEKTGGVRCEARVRMVARNQSAGVFSDPLHIELPRSSQRADTNDVIAP